MRCLMWSLAGVLLQFGWDLVDWCFVGILLLFYRDLIGVLLGFCWLFCWGMIEV